MKEKFLMCCMAKEDKKVLLLLEKIMVSISCMFGMIVYKQEGIHRT